MNLPTKPWRAQLAFFAFLNANVRPNFLRHDFLSGTLEMEIVDSLKTCIVGSSPNFVQKSANSSAFNSGERSSGSKNDDFEYESAWWHVVFGVKQKYEKILQKDYDTIS